MFVEIWGCEEGYWMNQGFCYKIFRTLQDYADAELTCFHEGAILARPMTYTQAEFLESLLAYDEEQNGNGTSPERKVYLGFHVWDSQTLGNKLFKKLRDGTDLGLNNDKTKDCVAMTFDANGAHLGWKWSPCEEPQHFICQKSNYSHILSFL